MKGSKGVIGCPYLDVGSFERFDEACAIVPAANTAGMLESKVTAVTPKARGLGIEVGMCDRELSTRSARCVEPLDPPGCILAAASPEKARGARAPGPCALTRP